MTDPFIAHNSAWPAGHRAALCVIVQVDAAGDGTSHNADTTPTVGLDYAPSGLQHLLQALADVDVHVTTAWTTRALAAFPQLAKRASEQGHEIAISGLDGPSVSAALTEAGRITQQPVVGVVEALTTDAPPRSVPTQGDTEFVWRLTGAGGDIPILETAFGQVVIPASPYWIDETWLHPTRPLPPSSLLEMWSTSLAAIRTQQGMMTIVLHPHIAGRPGILEVVIRFLDEAIASGDVWLTRADHLCTWWRDRRSESE